MANSTSSQGGSWTAPGGRCPAKASASTSRARLWGPEPFRWIWTCGIATFQAGPNAHLVERLSSVPSDTRSSSRDNGPPLSALSFDRQQPVAWSYSGQMIAVTWPSKSVTRDIWVLSTGQWIDVIAITALVLQEGCRSRSRPGDDLYRSLCRVSRAHPGIFPLMRKMSRP